MSKSCFQVVAIVGCFWMFPSECSLLNCKGTLIAVVARVAVLLRYGLVANNASVMFVLVVLLRCCWSLFDQ